jgi:hypothetical protein
MVVNSSFEKFLERIKLDDTRVDKIQKAHNAVREYLEKDEEVKEKYYETFLQGSYALNTAVCPQGDGEFDVDVILSLNLKSSAGILDNAYDTINWLAQRLKKSARYGDKVKIKNKCLRLNYAGEFHMDITPSHCDGDTDGVLLVPPHWKESHPKGYKKWCKQVHKSSGETFYQVTKMLKWWRNIHFGDDGQPRSIILTTLVGMHIPSQSESYDEALLNTMLAIDSFLQDQTLVPRICNPSLKSENLAQNWSYGDFCSFKDKFQKATKKAIEAFSEEDEDKTLDLWNSEDLFNDTFPKSKRALTAEAAAFNSALNTGTLAVTSAGFVSRTLSSNAIKVPTTKFFGGDEQ